MRRGHRNRWSYDQAPQGQGIVTVPTMGEPRSYATPQELANRDKTAGTIALLRKYGWLK